MSTSIPKTMKALIVQKEKSVAVQDHPVPQVGDKDILVKTVAVAQNPTDWKSVDFVTNAGTILGCDWSGYVVQTGKDVTSPKVGDHVAGFVQGGTYVDSGAYAEYIKTPAELSWVVPEGNLSHEEAATLGCGLWTAVQALYHPMRLALAEHPDKVTSEHWIYIHGGSTSVGQYAIQLAHLSGYKVVTTASPHNFELVKSLGADTVFDYKDPEIVQKIKDATGNSLMEVLDTISLKESQELSIRVIGPEGGDIMLLLPPNKEVKGRDYVSLRNTLIYTALGRTFVGHPASQEDRDHMSNFLKKVPQLVKEGLIKPNRIKMWQGGLHEIPDGLQYMREGKVSAEKNVYRI